MADQEQLDFLLKCSKNNEIEKWNNWRLVNSDLVINLRGANLKGANLSDAYLREAILREADLSYANLSGARLSIADLSVANLYKADLTGAQLYKADLSVANLYKADLTGANLHNADLNNADLNNADLSGANLINVNLFEAKLSKAYLCETVLIGAELSEANLNKADLSYANLNGSDLSYTNLSGANLSKANLSKANLSKANLSKANLSKANLRAADFIETNLFEADLTGADLTGANLSEANLSEADLRDAKFSHTILYKANLENAKLTGATLFNIAREGWNIKGVKCDYIYTDIESQQRLPVDRNFEEGEFEERFKSLPTFELPCRNESDLVFATNIAGFYNFRIESKSGLALKSIDIQQGTATYTVLKMDDLDAVKAIVKEYYDIKDDYIKLGHKCEFLEQMHDRLENKVIDKMGDHYEGDNVKGNKINISGEVTGLQIGDNNTQTIQTVYDEAAQKMKEEIEQSDTLSDDIKNILLEKLKSYAVDKGSELLSFAKHLAPTVIASIPTLQQMLN